MTTEFDEFAQALQLLKGGLEKDFGVANGGPIIDIGIDANQRVDNNKFGFFALLSREPTEEERASFPESEAGFPILYHVNREP